MKLGIRAERILIKLSTQVFCSFKVQCKQEWNLLLRSHSQISYLRVFKCTQERKGQKEASESILASLCKPGIDYYSKRKLLNSISWKSLSPPLFHVKSVKQNSVSFLHCICEVFSEADFELGNISCS